ncbi:MAG: prepilin-type N-terminal cleavage/methylation domain-containing protein [Candidatus Sumerlaeota bacterium]|nr:prepilin-type N-terminal cleavage/methylation domain-containing protein [Candidatus Sumerlaeota bacterium]
MKRQARHAITLIELLVVLAIIGLLSTIAANMYLQRLTLARVAATQATIHEIETAIAQYQVDVGQIPPSGSGTALAPTPPDNGTFPAQGCGYLFLCLTRSLNGAMLSPLDSRWHGPYLELPESRVGRMDGLPVDSTTPPASIQILDAWGRPFVYIRSEDYAALGGTQLPPGSPFSGVEVYYNANGYQIVSNGPNGTTLDPPNRGTDLDDIANFKNLSFSSGSSAVPAPVHSSARSSARKGPGSANAQASSRAGGSAASMQRPMSPSARAALPTPAFTPFPSPNRKPSAAAELEPTATTSTLSLALSATPSAEQASHLGTSSPAPSPKPAAEQTFTLAPRTKAPSPKGRK